MGDLASELEKAGVKGDPLYIAMVKHLQAADLDPNIAVRPFLREVCDGADLLVALMTRDDENAIFNAALRQLSATAREMKTGMPAGGGQNERDALTNIAPAAPAPDPEAGGHAPVDAQIGSAPASPDTNGGDGGQSYAVDHCGAADTPPPLRDGEGQTASDAQGVLADAAPETDRDRAGHTRFDAHSARARPAREPSDAERKAAKAARKTAARASLGWIGVDYIPGGPRYIDLRVRDIPGMIERQLTEGGTHARAAVVLKIIEREVEQAGQAPPDALWADILPEAKIKEIARATEMDVLKPMAVGWLRSFGQSAQNVLESRPDAKS